MPILNDRPATQQGLSGFRLMLLIVVVAGVMGFLSLPAHRVGTWTDDGFYISLARSLAAGEGMRLIHLPGHPATAIVPPGFPLLLSPVARLFPDSVTAFQWVSLLFTLATLPLFYQLAAIRLSPNLSLAAVALFALNPHIVGASIQVMSEAPFVFFLLLSVLLVEKLVTVRPIASWLLVLGAALATAALLLVRYFGLPVVGAIALYVLIRLRNRRAVAFVAVLALAVLVPTLAFGAEATMTRYSSVANILLGFLNLGDAAIPGATGANPAAFFFTSELGFGAAMLRNTQHLLTSALPDTIILLFGGPQFTAFFASLGLEVVPTLLQGVISALIFAGYGLCLRQRITVVEVVVPVYVLFLLVITQGKWPDIASAFRYIFPMIPFVLVYFLCIIEALDRLLRHQTQWPLPMRQRALLTSLVVASLLLLYLARNVQAITNPVRNRLPDVSLGATWIAENAPANAVVLAEIPRVSQIYAQRTTVPYADGTYEAAEIFDADDVCETIMCVNAVINRFRVNYVLVTYQISPELPFRWSRFTEQYVNPLMESDEERYQVVYASADGLVRVYQVNTTRPFYELTR